jgi:hypothetical protein
MRLNDGERSRSYVQSNHTLIQFHGDRVWSSYCATSGLIDATLIGPCSGRAPAVIWSEAISKTVGLAPREMLPNQASTFARVRQCARNPTRRLRSQPQRWPQRLSVNSR